VTNANDEAEKQLPTVLIVTDEPEIYRALRSVFSLSGEDKSSEGVTVDVGLARAATGSWLVVMPVETKFLQNATSFLDEYSPTLVVVIDIELDIQEYGGRLLVPSAIIDDDREESEDHYLIEAPRHVLQLLERVRMRGSWPVPSGPLSDFVMGAPRALALSSLKAVARGAASRGCSCLSIGVGFGFDVSDARFVAALLRNVDPSPGLAVRDSAPVSRSPSLGLTVDNAIEIQGVIVQFEMRSLRMLDRIIWQTPPARVGWHVILGDNASGKTSLLRALALCLLDRSDRDALRQGWNTWLRKGTSEGGIRIDLSDDDALPHPLSFDLRRVRPSKDATDPSVVDIHSSERVRYTGFLAAYGPFRRFTGGDPDWIKDFKNHPRLQSVLTLFDERAALSDALEWLKDLWVRARTQQPTPPEATFLPELLAFINTTDFLPEGVEILEPDADGVWCLDGNGQRVPATELSDGYRAVFSLVLDLLRRLAVANRGYDGLIATTPNHHVALGGIVLIDEVDAHLHPRWQQRIGLWFKERFPRMQFIVATHSPIVCQAADSVMLLPTPGEGAAPRMATPEELNRLRYGDLLDAFSTDFFGERVTRSQAGRDKLDRLAELNDESITRELTPEEQAEQAKLRDELGTVGSVTPLEDAG
jgi:energy-coupling factor transporter ATP-binding protein EcfA2